MSYSAQGLDIGGTTTAVAKVVEDPYLPQVTALILRLNELEQGDTTAPAKGIGLKHAVGPLELFVKYRENPWLSYAIVGGTVGLIFLSGFLVGRRQKGKK